MSSTRRSFSADPSPQLRAEGLIWALRLGALEGARLPEGTDLRGVVSRLKAEEFSLLCSHLDPASLTTDQLEAIKARMWSSPREASAVAELLLRGNFPVDRSTWRRLHRERLLPRGLFVRMLLLVEGRTFEDLEEVLSLSDRESQEAVGEIALELEEDLARFALLHMSKSPFFEVRAKAAEVASARGLQMPEYFWRGLLLDGDRRVRSRTARALFELQVGCGWALSLLRREMRLLTPEMIRLLCGCAGPEEARAFLSEVLERCAHRAIMEEAVLVMAEMGFSEVLEGLWSMCLTESIGLKVAVEAMRRLWPASTEVALLFARCLDSSRCVWLIKALPREPFWGLERFVEVLEERKSASTRGSPLRCAVLDRFGWWGMEEELWEALLDGSSPEEAICARHLARLSPGAMLSWALSRGDLPGRFARAIFRGLPTPVLLSLDPGEFPEGVLSSSLRAARLKALSSDPSREEELLEELRSALSGRDRWLILSALEVTSSLGISSLKDAVWGLLELEDEEVVVEAIRALGRIGDEEDLGYLMEIASFWRSDMAKAAEEASGAIRKRRGIGLG